METSTIEPPQTMPVELGDQIPVASTQPKMPTTLRKIGFMSTLLVVPAAYALGRVLGSRRTGTLAGGLALVGLGVVRWQLARWFAETPTYETVGRSAGIEMRRYPARVEATTSVEGATNLEGALERGYSRLECFVLGSNAARKQLSDVTPVLTTMRDGVFTTSFVMPSHTLPEPSDARVQLRAAGGGKIAVFPFRGGYTKENFMWQERRFLRALVDAGVATRGSITLATYDSPTVLPMIRKNELWIEVV